jgi:hypothetical protein
MCLVVLKAYECQYLEAIALPLFSQLSIRVLALGCLCAICIYKGVAVLVECTGMCEGLAASWCGLCSTILLLMGAASQLLPLGCSAISSG